MLTRGLLDALFSIVNRNSKGQTIMPPRITKAFLLAQVSNLNRMLGLTDEVYTMENNKITGGIEGVYCIDGAYGGYALHRMHKSTGESDVFNLGHVPARQLSELIDAYMRGMRDYRGNV